MVQDQDIKEQLANDAMLGPGNQFRTRDSSAVAFFLSDLEPTKRVNRIAQLEKPHRNPNYLATLPMVPSFLIGEGHAATLIKQVSTTLLSNLQAMPVVEPVHAWAYKNTSLVAQSFVFAAGSHDLASCMMEGYDGRKVQDILRIPDRYAVPLAVAIGYEYEDPKEFQATPRLPLEESVFLNSFGEPWMLKDEDNDDADDSPTKDDEPLVAAGR